MMKEVDLKGKTILVTGAAGFIGAALCGRLMDEFDDIKLIGLDEMNDYYDPRLKELRLSGLTVRTGGDSFEFINMSISDKASLDGLFEKYRPDVVVNLAAHAGVRYSIVDPYAFLNSNIVGFFNILECCRHFPVEHLVYASSSSVYGANEKVPYSEADKTDSPVSLYAATKKANEVLAYSYAEMFKVPSTGLRFFTVYGPAGRPDMAYYGFADKLTRGETIELFNYGECERDFTYIDDIVEGIFRVMQGAPQAGEEGRKAPFSVYNIGNSDKVGLFDFVRTLCEELKRAGALDEDFDLDAHIRLEPLQPGDVPVTFADVSGLEKDFGFHPSTSLREGLRSFCEWYAGYSDRA